MGVGEGGRHGRMRVECGSIAPYFIFSIVGALSSSVTSSGRGSGIPPPAGCSITLTQHSGSTLWLNTTKPWLTAHPFHTLNRGISAPALSASPSELLHRHPPAPSSALS